MQYYRSNVVRIISEILACTKGYSRDYTQYILKASTTFCSLTWADNDIYLVDQELKVVWRKLSGDTNVPILFLTFSIGIEDSVRGIKLSCDKYKDAIDTLKELYIAARKGKINVHGMSSDGY